MKNQHRRGQTTNFWSYADHLNLSQDSGLSPSPLDHLKKSMDTPPLLPPKKKSSPESKKSSHPDLQIHQMDFIQTQDFLRPSRVMSSSNSSLSNDRERQQHWKNRHRHRIEAKRNSLIFSSSDDEEILEHVAKVNELNEPFPPELDFSQIVGKVEFNSSMPPPPPPRDPKRRLYLSPDSRMADSSRPVSYSFENQPDLIVKPVQLHPEQYRHSRPICKEMRQGRAASASSYFKIPDLVQNPPAEYWKSPPFPFMPTFDPYVKSQCSTLMSEPSPPPRPPRPNLRKKLSNTSTDSGRGRDSALTVISQPGGKSSPSSSSVTSRDSGCPPVPSRPLSVLVEDSSHVNNIESEMEDVDVIELDPVSRSSSSPPKSNESHPGFSSKGRRSLFRKAMSEIEDVFKLLDADKDLLDRAERRDLPTAHQELIAQSRLNDPDCTTTSVNTSTENLIFSDMDNFMNWNTSSSFENIPERRQRAPSYRRSGVPDKTTDDVVFRMCRSNNKPVSLSGGDPGVRLSQSYLSLVPNRDEASNENNDPDEPDTIRDDYHNRFIRDCEASRPTEPEPQFGIPKDKICPTVGASKRDYLHAVPNPSRYRSTFNARKTPDTVLDDLAFRSLRKDDNPDNPDGLGIIKDPNQSSHSCWKHKMETRLQRPEERPSFPAVFYPKRDKKLMQALANDMAKVIRKTSTTPDGGKAASVMTYEDLLKDPQVMAEVKRSLGSEDDAQENAILDENDIITSNGRPRWAGKTLYELLRSGSSSGSTSSMSPSPPPLSRADKPEDTVTVVQHCQLQHQPLDLNQNPSQTHGPYEKKQSFISSTFLLSDRPTSVLRGQERLDSEEDEPPMTSACCQERTSPNNSLSSYDHNRGGYSSKMSQKDPSAASSASRMAKYKEERRRQLASQIANRLSSNHSSSSSDENEENSSSLDKYAKYRRHHRNATKPTKEDSSEQPSQPPLTASAGVSGSTPPVAVTRRRRRRSVTKESQSPATSPIQIRAKTLVHAQLGNDADGEDNADREDSPEHIYHQIGTDEVLRISKARSSRSPERKAFDSSDRVIITKNSASRMPRYPSKDKSGSPGRRLRNLSSPNFREVKTAIDESKTAANNSSSGAEKPISNQKSLLNTSYSSEEILLQAASSLQGLEDEFKNSSQYALKHRSQHPKHHPDSIGSGLHGENKFAKKTLSSPDMIKSLTKTLTPPISPHHKSEQPRFSSSENRSSPPSSTASNTSVPISDPLIDLNWPGRPKRSSLVFDSLTSPEKKRQVSPPMSSKPPIFPTSPKVVPANEEMPPFMKEFMMRTPTPVKRKSIGSSSPTRPQSAFMPQEVKPRSSDDPRRRSDFVSKYESLLNRAQAANKAVDELDFLRLKNASMKKANVEVEDEEEDEEDEVSVDFNEEEVLQKCHEFQKDYEKRKMQTTKPIAMPVPKPRSFIQGRPLASASFTEDRPNLRTRSSSLTLHDKDKSVEESSSEAKQLEAGPQPVFPRPILKKSSDDIFRSDRSILKRKSFTDDNPNARPEHIRIRSPSPDHENPRPILVRSRNSSLGEEEFLQSILKRRNSQEDLDGDVSASAGTSGATSRSSPEPPVHGILKRKLSLGNCSPEGNIEAISSILKKSGASTTHSSGQGSLEDLTSGSSSILHEHGIKSILKKRQPIATNNLGSTDDELDQEDAKPRSILKSRRSEESLSPLSDDMGMASASNFNLEDGIKPILKQRDSSRDEGYHSSKLRDKSRSPTRGSVASQNDLNEVLFSGGGGSSGVSTPLSHSGGRRSSLTFSPKRNLAEVSPEAVEASEARKSSFVSKTTVFMNAADQQPVQASNSSERVKFDSSSLPTSPTTDEGPPFSSSISGGILKRKGSIGSKTRSILKYDSFDVADDSPAQQNDHERPRRGVLKKDSSYDDPLRPILKYAEQQPQASTSAAASTSSMAMNDSMSSTSSEDLENLIDQNNRGFVDVVIDPMPKGGLSSSTSEDEEATAVLPSPRKSSLGPRLPVIPPSSVKITSSGNLACKLEALTGQAEAKLKQLAEAAEAKVVEDLQQQQQPKSIEKRPILSRKGSQDLPASEYYAIYQQSKSKKSICDDLNQDHLGANNERGEMSNNNADEELKVQGGGITERLAALKKNGEENWKKKVTKVEIPTNKGRIVEADDKNGNINEDDVVQLRVKPDIPVGKMGSVKERLSQLQTAQNSWQEKVGEKDVAKFTVAGKMGTPIVPTATRRISRREEESEMNAVNDKLSRRVKSTPKMRRFHGSPPPANDKSYDEPAASEASDNESIYSKTVEFHALDEDLDKFFANTATVDKQIDDASISLDDIDFDTFESNGNILLNNTRRPKKPLNHNKRRSKNPIKALAQRTDLKSSYNQKPSKSELKSVVILEDKRDVHAHLASEAKAGLAATEDFSNISLKKDNKVVPHAEFVPYKAPGETMLIQIKGRRMCQPRLVKPSPESINSGDAYVAVNGTDVVVWQGQYCNVIEKSKSADTGAFIVQKRDLGCKKASRVVLVEEDKVTEVNMGNKLFWKMLGCPKPEKAAKAGLPDEDETYEVEVNDLNLVWVVNTETSELVPIEEFWGQPMKHEVLENDLRVLVFDFGTEVYVWNGKNAAFSTRRLGLKLAKDMLKEEKKPEWTLFGRINQNMETILFREKFLNWPDESRLIKPEKESKKAKKTAHDEDNMKLSTEVENNFDAIAMARWPLEDPNYELEGTFIGRGRSYYDADERRQYEIETLQLNFWHVTDKDIFELAEKEHGQFYSGGTYVVRWKYKVSLTGKTLKGLPSKHVAVGRERWAYFFWHGAESKAAEQGLSALMTVELDEEKGPQIRVEEGQEHAVFLNLWKGKMAIHKGRREASKARQRLYFVKGEYPEEACAVQVECNEDSLRSRGCFVLFTDSKAIIWMGKGLPEHKKAVVESLKENWVDLRSIGGSITFESEGQESDAFKKALAFGDGLYDSRLSVPSASMRLYHMTSVSGEFEVNEVVCPFLKSEGVPNVMSFNQADLYKAEQPALFLVESGNEKLWLWQGWWPDVGHESNDTNMTTGSGMIRWHAERREAMRTVKEFQRSKFSKMTQRPPMELVWAGHEPVEFTNLFPSWKSKLDIQCLNAKFVGESSLDRVFALLGRDHYSWEELQQRPFPDGVDPSRLEKYLSDEDFVKYLGLSRADFTAAPRWKQLEIRKEKGLF